MHINSYEVENQMRKRLKVRYERKHVLYEALKLLLGWDLKKRKKEFLLWDPHHPLHVTCTVHACCCDIELLFEHFLHLNSSLRPSVSSWESSNRANVKVNLDSCHSSWSMVNQFQRLVFRSHQISFKFDSPGSPAAEFTM